jgi:hypothetical protein
MRGLRTRSAVILILLCVGISVYWGTSLGRAKGALVDFRAVYFGARCMALHQDPYNSSEFQNVYEAEDGSLPLDAWHANTFKRGVFVCINLPTTLLLVAPLALLARGWALFLWISLTGGFLAITAYLMWSEGRRYASGFALFAACLVAVNAEVLIGTGNAAGIAVGLCIVAAWCFVTERLLWVGVICMALALAMKPHDAGWVWLFFILRGGFYRRRALQVLLIVVLLAVPSVIWISHVSPDWVQELRSNLMAGSAPGGINEPGPFSVIGLNAGMVISLQSAVSVFTRNSTVYNSVSYLICGAFLLVWVIRTVQAKNSRSNLWIGIAAVVAPTLLITYHRSYDAKLLLLTIPACAMLWLRRGFLGWFAVLSTSAAIVSTGDIPLTVWIMMTGHLHLSASGFLHNVLAALLLEPPPLILLVMGCFYLWVYVKRDISGITFEGTGELNQASELIQKGQA